MVVELWKTSRQYTTWSLKTCYYIWNKSNKKAIWNKSNKKAKKPCNLACIIEMHFQKQISDFNGRRMETSICGKSLSPRKHVKLDKGSQKSLKDHVYNDIDLRRHSSSNKSMARNTICLLFLLLLSSRRKNSRLQTKSVHWNYL